MGERYVRAEQKFTMTNFLIATFDGIVEFIYCTD